MQITATGDGAGLKISGILDIAVADELRAALATYAERESPLLLDLSGVDAADASALQLLCSFRQTVHLANQTIQVAALPPALAEACAAIGLPVGEFLNGS